MEVRLRKPPDKRWIFNLYGQCRYCLEETKINWFGLCKHCQEVDARTDRELRGERLLKQIFGEGAE